MDSIEAKTQQLKTSLQSLYTSTGVQNLFKGILDYGNNIVTTFTKMPTVFNLPIVAIAKFGTQFFTLANVVTNVFGLIKARLTSQSKILQGQMTADAKMGETARVQISQEEMAELQAILEQGPEARAKLEERMTQIARKGANDRTNIAKGEARGVSKAMAKGGLIASAAGSALSMISAGMGDSTQGQRTTKGLTDILGTALSGVGTGLMIGGIPGAVVGTLTALPGLITGISTIVETAAEREERLKKAVEETNNAYLQRKDEAKTLEEQIEKLEELEKAQNDSVEAKAEFVELSNQIAEQHPELITGFDLEGNALIDLTSSYYALKKAREAANEAAKETAKASIEQADNDIKTAEDNRNKVFDEYRNKLTESYGNSKLDELFSFAKDNNIEISKDDENAIRAQIKENVNWVATTLENVYTDLVFAYQEAGTSLQDVLVDIVNSNEEIKNNDTISSITEEMDSVSFEEQEVIKDIEDILLTGNYEDLTESINANREYLNSIRDKLIDEKGEDFWATKYLESWLELNGEATDAMADVEKATQMRASLIKSKISSISSSILSGEQNDFGNEYLKEMEAVNSFVAQALSQKQKKLENPEEGQEAVDPQKFIDDYLENKLKDVQDFLQKFWTTYLDTESEKNKFNQLIQNAKQYSSNQMEEELLKLAPQLTPEELNTFITSIYGEELDTISNNFKQSVEKRFSEQTKQLYSVLENIDTDEMGQADLSAILEVYDKLATMVSSGAMTDSATKSLFEQYNQLWESSKKIEDSTDREQIQSAIQELDLTSLESVDAFTEAMTEIGFLDENTAKKLRESVPVNLNTEVNTYVEKISSEMEDFESALSKATGGMKYKDAAAIAAKMGASVDDFRQVGDKFFIDDLDALEKAYFDTSNDLVEGLHGKIAQLSKGLNSVKNVLFNDDTLTMDEFDAKKYFSDNRFKNILSDALQEVEVNVNLESLQLESTYNQWLEASKETEISFIDYLIQQLTSSLEEAEKVQKVINTQKAENYLAQGNFTKFLENLDLDKEQRFLAQEAFNKGNLDEVFEIIPQYADKITGTFKKINQDIYNRMVSETSSDNWIKRDDSNKVLIADLAKAGLIKQDRKDQDGNFWYKLEEITETNIQAYYDTITNDANLTGSEKATARAKATTELWNKSLNRYLQEAFKNTESVSQETAEQLRTLLGLSDEDFNTIFEENGNNYILNASELARIVNESGKKISSETLNMGNEAIQKTTDSIIKEISTATDLLSKGSTSAADIEKFVSDFNKVTGQNLTADQMFSFDETLDTSVLNSKYYQQYVAAKKAEMLQYGATEEQVNNYVDKLTKKSLAAAVDINSFLKAENREVGSQAYNKLADQMRDFYAKLGYSSALADSIVEKRMKNMLSGGNEAVQNLVYWAEKADTEVSSSDVEQTYRAEISQLENAFNQLSYGVGSLISGQAVDILEAAGYGINRIEGTDSAVIESIGNIADAYEKYYNELKKTGEATVAALNEAYAKVLETRDGSDVISALGDAASMTYTRLGEILASKGIELTDELLAQYSDAIQSIGGGKVRITNFDKFATEIMGWTDIDKNSEEYISAFKTYNDSLIDMNRKAERNIVEEVQALEDAQAGDQINLTQLVSGLNDSVLKILSDELLKQGALLENGILTLGANANIPAIIQTLSETAAENGLILQDSMAELADTLNSVLENYISLVNSGIEGSLSNAEAQQLQLQAQNFGFTEKLDFTRTAEGLKLSQESAIKLYNELKKVDYLQSQLVFKELSDSLKENNSNYKDMSSILARIKTLEEEISNIPASDARRKKYEEELALAKEIKETRSLTDPDSFNFMGNDIPDAMKGAENYWNSWGNAFKAMNEAGESGYMGITDFYNIVNEMNNLAKMSGNTLTFMGKELSGDAKDAANLIQEGMGYLANVDGSGVSVALKKFGTGFAKDAAGMQTGVKGGIKAMAESQIEMLDAMIGLLEVIVAFEKFGELDTDGEFGLSFDELFESYYDPTTGEVLYKANANAQKIAGDIIELAKSNKDLDKALDEVKINGVSAREALEELNSDNLKTKDEWENYRKITDIMYRAAASGDYSTQNLTQLIREAFGDSNEVTEVEVYGRKFAVKGDIIVEQDKNGNYVVDGQKYKDAKQAIEAQTFKQKNNLEEVVRNEDGTYSGSLLIDRKYQVIATSTLNEDGSQEEPTYSINGQGNYTREQAIEELYKQSGYDNKQDWILNSNVVAQFNMTITEIKATLGENTNLGDLSDDLLSQLGIDVNLVNAVEAGIERAFSENGGGIGTALIEGIAAALKNSNFDDQDFIISDIPVKADKVTVDVSNSKKTFSFGSVDPKAAVEGATEWIKRKENNFVIPNIPAKVDKVTYSAPKETDAKAIIGAATTVGQNVTAGLAEGMSDTTTVTEKAAEVGTAVVDAINTAAGTHSPSTITTQTGKDLVKGLINGLSDGEVTIEAVSQATSLAQQIINAIQAYFNANPLSLSAGLNTPETPTPKKQSSTSTPTPAAPQTIAPVADLSGITALQNAITALSSAGTAAAAELGQVNANLINSTVKATNFEDALSKISDSGKIKAEDFEKALSSIGDNGKKQAEDFQTALSNIGDNGKQKADDFSTALDAIKQDGITNANNFKDAVNAVQSSGATNASNFKDAVNNTGSTGASNASLYKNAVNDTGSGGANNASAYRYAVNGTYESGAKHAERFKEALNTIDNTTLNVDISVNVSGNGQGQTRVTGTKHRQWSWAKGNALSRGKTLMGELGPELVVSHGRYFLVGQNGPEMVDLDEDAIVFNHLQTQKLIQQGKVNTHGSPITNERKATSMATGNFSGSAMASASEVLAILKQLREMWKSLLGASMRDLGISAGKTKDKDKKTDKDPKDTVGKIKDDTETAEKYIAGIEGKVERWYNWLKAIEETQYEINKLTKEYTLMEKQGVSTEEQLANLTQQYAKRRENAETRQQLIEEQTAYRTNYINEANKGLMSAFYQADPETGQVYVANDDAFQKFLKEQQAKGMKVGALGSVLAESGQISAGTTIQRGLTQNEKERLADQAVKQRYSVESDIPDYVRNFYEEDKENGGWKLKEDQEEKARKHAINYYGDNQQKYHKDVTLTRDIKTGTDLMAELNATDAAGNLVHSAADQLAILKEMGVWTADLEANIDKTSDNWEAEVMQRFYDKVEEDKTEIESLTDSIREQEQAALDDAIAMQEINEKIRNLVKPVVTVTKELTKWYNESKRIQKVQQEINKLIKEMTLLQGDQKINGAEIYTNLMEQAAATKRQIALNEDLIKKRKQENLELQKKYSDLPISIDEKTGLATFSENKIGAVNGQTSVTTSYRQVKRNELGYEVDVNGNYRDDKGVLRNSAGEKIDGNFGELATEIVQGATYDFSNKTLPQIIEDLNKTDETGKALYNDEQKYQILQAAGFGEYMRYDENGNEIYDGIGEMTKDQMTQAVNAGVSRLQSIVDKINTNNDEANNLEEENLKLLSDLNSIQQQLIDNQISVEKMVNDAVVQQHQDAIDSKKELKDALEKASQNTIDGLKDGLAAEKSMYEKTTNETELASLQRQLSVAQMSGGSMSEIQNLQQQIAAKQQEMYFAEREDLIDKLEQSVQREIESLDTQIGIMEATLQYQIENGLLWGEVNQILSQTPAAIIDYITAHNPAYISASEAEREKQLISIGDQVTEFKAYQADSTQAIEDALGEQTEELGIPDVVTKEGEIKEAVDGVTEAIGDIDLGQDQIEPPNEPEPSNDEDEQDESRQDDSGQDSDTNMPFDGLSESRDGEIVNPDAPVNIDLDPTLIVDGGSPTTPREQEETPRPKKEQQETPKPEDKDEEKTPKPKKKGQFIFATEMPWWDDLPEDVRKRFFSGGRRYANGGSINYTGPAWVDGTEKEPEHIFNFEQMNKLREHLLNGVDVTRQAVSSISDITQELSNSNIYNNTNSSDNGINIEKVDFHMEVKEISNDYDARKAGEQAMEEIVRIARKSGTRSLSRR